jgi:hypothetical protein
MRERLLRVRRLQQQREWLGGLPKRAKPGIGRSRLCSEACIV